MLTPVSKVYWHLMLSHAFVGIAGSFLYSPATAVAGHWFMRKRSTAVGIVVCGSGLAGVIYPIMMKRLIELLSESSNPFTKATGKGRKKKSGIGKRTLLMTDFRDAILIIMGMNALLLMFSCVTMKARLPPRTPPPLKSLLGPWSEIRYSCLVIGSSFIMMK